MNEGLIETLKNYWEAKKGENAFPELYDMSEGELEEIWNNCFIAEVSNNKFVYETMGESVIDAYELNMQGLEVTEDLLYPESPNPVHKMIEVLNAKEPVIYDGAFINRENVDIKFRKILLPLGENGKVTHIFGGIIWQAF